MKQNIEVSDAGLKYPRLDEYSPHDLEKLKVRYIKPEYVVDPFLNLWGVVQSTAQIKEIEEYCSLNTLQLTFLLNYLSIMSEIRNRKIMFNIINISKFTVQELDYELMKENQKLLIKTYNLKPFFIMASFVMLPSGQWFLMVTDIPRKTTNLIDFNRQKDDPTVKDSFDVMVDIYKDLYDLNIQFYKMGARVQRISIGDTNDARIFYILYMYKFIVQAKHTKINISDYEFQTCKDRVLLLILKIKLLLSDKLKKIPDQITQLQNDADDENVQAVKHAQEKLEEKALEKDTDLKIIEDQNILLPLIEQYDPLEFKALLKKHKQAKPINLKEVYNQHFGLGLTYEDIEIFDVGGDITQRLMKYLINYLLYQNQKKLMRKLVFAMIKVEEESDKYFSYNLQYPDSLQEQLIPDVEQFNFLCLLMRYRKRWILSIQEPILTRGIIVDFKHNEKVRKGEEILADVKDVFIGDFDLDISDVYTYYKMNQEGQKDCGVMIFYYLYKFLNARNYEQIKFTSEQEKKEMNDRLLWLLLKMQYIRIQPEFDQNKYFKMRTKQVYEKDDEYSQDSNYDPKVGKKPKNLQQKRRKPKEKPDQQIEESIDSGSKTLKRQHLLVPPNMEEYDTDSDAYDNDKESQSGLNEIEKEALFQQKIQEYQSDHPSMGFRDEGEDIIYFNQDHRNTDQEKQKQLLQKLYKDRENMQVPKPGDMGNMSYGQYRKMQLRFAEQEKLIRQVEESMQTKKKQKQIQEEKEKKARDEAQKLIDTALLAQQNQQEKSEESVYEENPEFPHLDGQYKQFLHDKYQQYIPKSKLIDNIDNKKVQTEEMGIQATPTQTNKSLTQSQIQSQTQIMPSNKSQVMSQNQTNNQSQSIQKSYIDQPSQSGKSRQTTKKFSYATSFKNQEEEKKSAMSSRSLSQSGLSILQSQQYIPYEGLEENFKEVINYMQSNNFDYDLHQKPELAQVVSTLKYNFAQQRKEKEKQQQPKYYASLEPTETDYQKALKNKLGDSIDQMLFAESYLQATQKYEKLYGEKKKPILNKNNQYEILKQNDQIYSKFYVETRNDISVNPAYFDVPVYERKEYKPNPKSPLILEMYGQQIHEHELNDMTMIDRLTPNMINFGIQFFQRLKEFPKMFVFPCDFSKHLYVDVQNKNIDYETLKKYIPYSMKNVFENLEFLCFCHLIDDIVTHFVILDMKKQFLKVYQMIGNHVESSLMVPYILEKSYRYLQQLYNSTYFKELNENIWKKEKGLGFQVYKDGQGAYLMFSMIKHIQDKNYEFQSINNRTIQQNKNLLMKCINDNKVVKKY